MQAADHQAGQRMESRDDQLIGGEGQRDAVEHGQPAAAEPALHAVLGELFLAVVGGCRLDLHVRPRLLDQPDFPVVLLGTRMQRRRR
jgi:hypothetical protein